MALLNGYYWRIDYVHASGSEETYHLYDLYSIGYSLLAVVG